MRRAIKIRTIFWTALILLVTCCAGWAADYYVDINRGNDGNSGTLDHPWKTISKANSTLRAGDTAFIRSGTYRESIRPSNSGSAGARIEYSSYNNESVLITGVNLAVDLNSRSYITVNDIDASHVTVYVEITRGHHNWIQYCNFDNLNNNDSWPTGIKIQHNAHHNKFYKVKAVNCGKPNAGGVLMVGNTSFTDTSNYNLFERCTFANGGHHVINFRAGYNIFRNNLIYNEKWMANNTYGDRGINGQAKPGYGDFIVLEGNVFSYSALPSDASFAAHAKYATNKSIVRNNLFYNSNGDAWRSETWTSNESNDHRVYNNVFYRNGYRSGHSQFMQGIGFCSYKSSPVVKGTVVVNNIFHENKGGSISYRFPDRDLPSNHDIRSNWWDSNSDPLFKNKSLSTPWDTTLPDLSLRDDSPCIDAGEFLTNVTSPSGSGRIFQVKDAAFFIDGWGIVEGDLIQLEGKKRAVRIENIDYKTNRITVDRDVDWNTGDGVSLTYSGSAPDFGAIEYGVGLSSPLNLRILN